VSKCAVPDNSVTGPVSDPNDAHQNYFSVGATAGVGPGIGFSNADSANQIAQITDAWTLTVPVVSLFGVQASMGAKNGIWQFSIQPVFGLGAGFTHGKADWWSW
jgi:hypothetical protein